MGKECAKCDACKEQANKDCNDASDASQATLNTDIEACEKEHPPGPERLACVAEAWSRHTARLTTAQLQRGTDLNNCPCCGDEEEAATKV